MARMQLFVSPWAPRLQSVLRIVAAVMYLSHGSQKLFLIPQGQMQQAVQLFSLPWFGGVLEFCGGILLLLGLFTRPVAFILAGEMAVAYWMGHAPHGPWPTINMGETAVLYCFIWLYFAAAGAGPWRLDALIWGRRRELL